MSENKKTGDIIIEQHMAFVEQDVRIAGRIYNIKGIDQRAIDEAAENIRNQIAYIKHRERLNDIANGRD